MELTRECLRRIEQLNPTLNAFITVTEEAAIRDAQQAELEIHNGHWRGPLHGIPGGLKDLIDTAGVRTTAASRLFAERIPSADADVVVRLKQAGAIILGKQNAHEFAYGGSSVISAYGAVANAWNPAHISGGSSGGSATAVAAGMGYFAIGTDTAGSIREPASLCGVVGLKSTYGRVRAEGVVPLSWSLDHVGPITNSVADAALVLAAIADPATPPLASLPVINETPGDGVAEGVRELRVGIPRDYFYENLDPEVEAAVAEALAVVALLTCETKEISLKVSEDRTLSSAESYAYHREWVESSPDAYHPDTLRRILAGANTTPEQVARAKADLERMRQEIVSVFGDVDVLVTPTTPTAAPSLAYMEGDIAQLRPREVLLLRNTRPFNVWGVPAISIPCGFTRSGLPIGLQIAAAPWREDLVLQLAAAYENVTEWHRRRPSSGQPPQAG